MPERFPISNRQRQRPIDKAAIRRLARFVCRQEGRTHFSASLVVTGDDEIHAINREFLNHDRPTDVISFPLGGATPEPGDVDGEVVVSVQTARRVAAERGIDETAELYRYVTHGLLHLMDYDDTTPAARRRMTARQEALLADFLESETAP